MSIRKGSYQQFVHSILWGAAGFGIGFAMVGIIAGLLGYCIKDLNTRLYFLSVPGIFTSSFGGAMLGWAEKPKAPARQFALTGAAGWGFGYFVSVAYQYIVPPSRRFYGCKSSICGTMY